MRIVAAWILSSLSVFGWQAPSDAADSAATATRMRAYRTEIAATPNSAGAIRSLALIYAQAIYNRDSLRAAAIAELDATENSWVLSNTAYALRSLYNDGLQRGLDNRDAAELAEWLFVRAQAIDPKLDRSAILPVIDLEQIAKERDQEQRRNAELLEQATKSIRRLPVDAFPELPSAVAGALRSRDCAIPQPRRDGRANVIRGAFFEPGKRGWAALCSVAGSSLLLVFRDDRDRNPVVLGTTEDRGWLQGDGSGYVFSHEIAPADRTYIEQHARPEVVKPSSSINHEGINDMFVGKASTVRYFDRGTWLDLPGAD